MNGIFVKIRQYLPRYILQNLYYTFVYPYLVYCNIVWASSYQTHLNRLEILQKKIVRIITFSPPNLYTASLFDGLELLQFRYIHIYLIGTFMYKYNMGMLPAVFQGWFTLTSSVHNYNTRQSNLCYLPMYRTNLGQFSLRFQGSKVWNKLQLEIRQSRSVNNFKISLKQYLLNEQLK